MNYIRIDEEDMLNGEGMRVVLWVAGCGHHCKGCHNPESWNENFGEKFTKKEVEKILNLLERNHIAGLTFTGGDPMYVNNKEEVLNLAKTVKAKFGNTKTIWLWTGYTYNEIKNEEILKYIDVLVDGRFELSKKTFEKQWVGSSNQNVIYLNKN